jgi:HPt (histidine-containing phosphotransfer) domain-containing protein
VRAGSADEIRRLAHSCAGASATCGMGRIVPFLRELEHQAEDGILTHAADLTSRVHTEFERIRAFLEPYLAGKRDLAGKN